MSRRACCLVCVALGLGGLGLGGLGCATERPGIPPNPDTFYFPTGLALDLNVDDAGRAQTPLLFVSNTNTDLRYNGGTVMALDLSRFPEDLTQIGAWTTDATRGLDCAPAVEAATRWACPETQFIVSPATVRVGDFPGDVRLVRYRDSKGRATMRLFTPVRAERHSLTVIDVVRLDGPAGVDLRCHQDCAETAETHCGIGECDETYQVDHGEGILSLPDQPFGILVQRSLAVFIDHAGRRYTDPEGTGDGPSTCGTVPPCRSTVDVACCFPPEHPDDAHVYLSHLSQGQVSFFRAFLGAPAPGVELVDVRENVFASQEAGAALGAFGIVPSVIGDPQSPIFVSSRADNLLASFVIRDNVELVQGPSVAIGALGLGNDALGMAFDAAGQRLYVVNRAPAALVALDMRPEAGRPRAQPLWAVEVCGQPSLLELAPDPDCLIRHGASCPQGALAYVICYEDASIFVIDTARAEVVGHIFTGAGPHTLLFDHRLAVPNEAGGTRDVLRAFVANFLDNTVGVIDLDPRHTTYRQMLARIGEAQWLAN